jgi:predicted RecB family nuclease
MISKTDYITYLKHPAWLWLRKHDPEFLPTPDDNSQAIVEEGREFERLAEQIFPEAIRLDGNNYADMQEWADETKALLEQDVETILQAAFLYDGFLCIADAITKDGDGYILTEIKATTSPDKEHICDLAFQKTVIEWSGFPVTSSRVLHANKEYIRHGDIKLEEIVAFTDVTEKVNKEILNAPEQMRAAARTAELEEMPSDSLRHVGLGAAGDSQIQHLRPRL